MGHAEPGAGVAEDVAGGEVVGAVEDEVVVGDDVEGGAGVEPLGVLDDLGLGADRVHRLGRGGGLRAPDVGDAVHDLALEVGRLHDVVVDDPDRPDAGGREVEQRRRAQAARPDDEHAGRAQPSLADGAQVRQEHVARVARALPGGELGAGRHERGSGHGATLTTGLARVPGCGVTRP